MLAALFAGVFRYADDHFHDEAIFLENTAELGNNADVRERLFNGFRTGIIQLADGDASPEDAAADDAAQADDDGVIDLGDVNELDPVDAARNARDIAIEEILIDVFNRDAYDEAFLEAITSARGQIIRAAELEPEALLGDSGDVLFNMRRLQVTVNQELAANPATVDITRTEVPEDFGVFKVADRSTTWDFLWSILRNAPNWRGLATLVAIASFIGAVAVAERRPSTAIQFGVGLVGVALVLIVVVFLVRFTVPLLASESDSAAPVVAVYAVNTWPLVWVMVRLAILGAVVALIAGVAKLIWPDDWVYSSVSDERGVRSVRRRGKNDPEPTAGHQQVPVAAAAAVPYPGYAPVPYGTYPQQQWGQPYPGHYPPPGYGYPVGPYAQPQPVPQQYASPGRPTVPVLPVGDDLVPPAAPPLDGLPADAVQVVPKVVTSTDDDLHLEVDDDATSAVETVVADLPAASRNGDSVDDDVHVDRGSSSESDATGDDRDDEWATEADW